MKKPRHLSAAALLLSATAISVTLGYQPDDSRWESASAIFHIGMLAQSGQIWADAFRDAMTEWSDETDFTFIAGNIAVDPCSGYSRNVASGGSGFPSGNGDTSNSAGFSSSVCGNDFSDSVLAVTLNISSTGRLGIDNIMQSDIIFNAAHNWEIYDGPNRDTIDFRRVALHELGHSLGLNHEPLLPAIMAPRLTGLDSLQQDDIAGVNAHYGSTFACLVTNLPLDARVNDSLETGDCRVADMFSTSADTSLVDVYRFSIGATTLINLSMTSAELDAVLVITDTSLNQKGIFDDSGNGCDAVGSLLLEPGDYLLMANTYDVHAKCAGNAGSYSLTITESTQPVLGAIRNASGGSATAAALITGGATTTDSASFATSFTASEQIDVLARLAPDISHVGLPGRLYVLATLDDGRQFMKAANGGFLPYPGNIAGLQAFHTGNLAMLEPITIIDNLNGIGSGLAGHTFTVHVGYAMDSSPLDIYYGSSPIRFTIGAN